MKLSSRGLSIPWVTLILFFVLAVSSNASGASPVYRVDHVVDGDTIALRSGQRVRLVQIDTPEVYFGTECYGRAASQQTKRLLPTGSRVRLFVEPATDRVDQYGRRCADRTGVASSRFRQHLAQGPLRRRTGKRRRLCRWARSERDSWRHRDHANRRQP
jgi:hypothetical protein